MKLTVRFFASLRELVGNREEHYEFPTDEKVNLEVLLNHLVELHGRTFYEYIFNAEKDELKSYLTFLVNGKSVGTMEGLKTDLKDGDTIAILPPVGGG